jgi:hypothetical protein
LVYSQGDYFPKDSELRKILSFFISANICCGYFSGFLRSESGICSGNGLFLDATHNFLK